MITPAAVQDTGGDYSTEASQQQQIPITDINLALLRKMNATQTSATLPPQTTALFGKPTAYKVGPGDVLQIVVWDHPELAAALGQPAQNAKTSDAAPGFLIDENGDVQFPYAGTVHVAGKDVGTIQKDLHKRLSNVYQKPEVTVRVASFRNAQVYVDGEVRTPGAQSVTDIPLSLTSVINQGGGFSPNADRSRVELIRNGVTYPLNVDDLIKRGRNPSDIYLQAGDIVRVASREDSGVYVMGEVNKPATILPMRNGTLTLSQAISDSGSFDSNTAAAQTVVRDPQFDQRIAAGLPPRCDLAGFDDPRQSVRASTEGRRVCRSRRAGPLQPCAEPAAAGDQCGCDGCRSCEITTVQRDHEPPGFVG